MLKSFLLSLCFISCALSAPPVLVVTPQNPKPGDVVTVVSKTECNFEVRGASAATLHGKRAVVFDMTEAVLILASEGKTTTLADVAVINLGAGSTPIPPTPDNSEEVKRLSEKFKKAYELEAEADKADSLKKLIDIYKSVGGLVDSGKVKDYGDLQEALKEKAVEAGLSEKKDDVITVVKLKILRAVVGSELMTKLPTKSDTPIEAATAKKVFATFAESLSLTK